MKLMENEALIYKITGITAYIISGLLFISLPNVLNLSPVGNWLILLFKINSGFADIKYELLRALNFWDFIILALVSVTFFGLYTYFKKSHKVWSFIALIQPILGIFLLAFTGLLGRSGVMGSTLVISVIALSVKAFGKTNALLGILASILLLIGDFGTSKTSHSILVASFIAAGYLLLIAWFLLVGKKLISLTTEKE